MIVTINETAGPYGQEPADGLIDGRVDPAARPVRRTFTAAYRAQIVAEYEAAPHGSKSAVLRREGLYQSTIREWTQARDALVREAVAPARRHRSKSTGAGGQLEDPGRLRAENTRLTRELAKSQAVVEIMGKLHGLLEMLSERPDTALTSTRR